MSFDRHILTIVILICLGLFFFGGWMIKESERQVEEVLKLQTENDSLKEANEVITLKFLTK